LVYSIAADFTEVIIQTMTEGAQRMIRINNSQEEEPEFLNNGYHFKLPKLNVP
jgi:hypothetical protein